MNKSRVLTSFCVVERDFAAMDLEQLMVWRGNIKMKIWVMICG
jgi:hypothetical protein